MGLALPFVRLLAATFTATTTVSVFVIGSAACNAQIATVLSSDASADSSGGASCTADQECNDNPATSSLRGRCSSGVCVCNPGVAATPNGKCGDITGGPLNACVAQGGLCLMEGQPPPSNYRRATVGEGSCDGAAVCWLVSIPPLPKCSTDQDCNGNPSVSALWGTCFHNVCMCKTGFTVQPNGKCNTPPPPDCATQKGTCRQQPAQCLADELGSAETTDMSCGDLIAAVCCNNTKSCNGPFMVPQDNYVPVDFTCCAANAVTHPPICVNGWQTCPTGDTPVAKPATCG